MSGTKKEKMKKIIVFLIFIFTSFNLSAQAYSTSHYLYKFSPLAEIIVRNLGLEDKNANGVIDKGANEGYEGFIEKYGTGDTLEKKEKSIDSGFYANYVIYGAGNSRLEENEIVNYYYLNIRFKYPEETAIIDKEIKTYVYANNLPLVWLDDEKGTVMKAVTKVLGEGWNEKQVTEDEAVNLLYKALQEINIRGRQGLPSKNNGYYTLPEFTNKKYGYCLELAQFGFWFFSELKINSIFAWMDLTKSLRHEVIKLGSGKIVDYFNTSKNYNVPKDNWYVHNPMQVLSVFCSINERQSDRNVLNAETMLEQNVINDKYNIDNIVLLLHYHRRANNNETVIEIGEFFLQNSDIDKILNKKHYASSLVKEQIKVFLIYLLGSYHWINNRTGNDMIVSLLKKYYPNDNDVKDWIKAYN